MFFAFRRTSDYLLPGPRVEGTAVVTNPMDCSIVRITTVSDAQRQEMLALHRRYFVHVLRRVFLRDMREKDWVIWLRHGGRMVGFSTLQVMRLPVRGREHVFLFSGDTVVERPHWQSTALAGSFGHFMLRMMEQHGEERLHWFLISKGFRTYRFLPVFFNRFYPVHDARTPREYQALLDTAASAKFGSAYDPGAGIVRMAGKKDRLKPEYAGVPESRQSDPHVVFFLNRNLGWRMGDELACITDVRRDNLNRYAWRVIRQNKVAWHE